MPHQTEPSANDTLGNILQGTLGKATVLLVYNSEIIFGIFSTYSDGTVLELGVKRRPS